MCSWAGSMHSTIFSTLTVPAVPQITYDDKLKEPQTIVGGYKLTIDTQISGVPAPTNSWTFNGEPLTPSENITIETTSQASKLTIVSATLPLSGTYTLTAVNDVGSATAEFNITVKGT